MGFPEVLQRFFIALASAKNMSNLLCHEDFFHIRISRFTNVSNEKEPNGLQRQNSPFNSTKLVDFRRLYDHRIIFGTLLKIKFSQKKMITLTTHPSFAKGAIVYWSKSATTADSKHTFGGRRHLRPRPPALGQKNFSGNNFFGNTFLRRKV